jgi:hypothetical protein
MDNKTAIGSYTLAMEAVNRIELYNVPWLYAIAEPNGHWQDGESCVFQDLESCQSMVDDYNQNIGDDEPRYTVVPLYRYPVKSN